MKSDHWKLILLDEPEPGVGLDVIDGVDDDVWLNDDDVLRVDLQPELLADRLHERRLAGRHERVEVDEVSLLLLDPK